MKLWLLSAILALVHVQTFAQFNYCFGQDAERSQTRHFSSKTAYQIIKGTNIDKQYLVPGCETKKIWILHRHGTRLPSSSDIIKMPRLEEIRDQIVKNYRVLRNAPDTNALCTADLIALQMWKWNSSITPDMDNYLTSQGYEDLKGTAKLYQRYYPEILPRQYNNTYYQFRHTDFQRTQESFKAFAEGLFGANSGAQPLPIPVKELLLRPSDYCRSWQDQNYKNEGSESYLFRQTKLWNDTMADISRRLGYDYTLATEDIELIYDMCRYEQAWQVDRTSVWCAAFLPQQVTVFEYQEDLRYYYKAGYGYEENTHLNCRLVQDLLKQLSNNFYPNVIAYFGHSNGVQTLISALGINKDDIKLTANNYDRLTDRRWRTSNMDPFASNFMAVKYNCPAEAIDKEKVIFFLNQNAVELSWCNVGLCNWSEVLKRYETIANANCDEFYCRSGAGAVGVSLFVMLIVSIAYLLK